MVNELIMLPLLCGGMQLNFDTVSRLRRGNLIRLVAFLSVLDIVLALIQYSIPEETKEGYSIGDVVKDLGLVTRNLSGRKLRVASEASKQYFEVNLENGMLIVAERIDREELCGHVSPCELNIDIVIENPLEIHSVAVEIQDINDNAPEFPNSEIKLEISEAAVPGVRFPLEGALDLDVGTNSLQSYSLNQNNNFILNVLTHSDSTKYAELVLQNALDREEQQEHILVLTAVDGGFPARSCSIQVVITVLDSDDNSPVFDKSIYTVHLEENAPKDTLIVRVNAVDLDDGPNGEVMYFFGSNTPIKLRTLFNLDSTTGEIKLNGVLDFEETANYEIHLQVKDKGPNPDVVHCKVLVHIIDVNDNAPEVVLTSIYSPVPENSAPETVIAILSVRDLDSGDNGRVLCSLSSESDTPFSLTSSIKNYYTLKTISYLDREIASHYNLTIIAIDSGTPSLWTKHSLLVEVSDVNDNPPKFSQASYEVYVEENNPPGVSLFTVTASDSDVNQNAHLTYTIYESHTLSTSGSKYFFINSENGTIFARHSFDYEKVREYQILVNAQDAGTPSLTNSATVNVYIVDQNDNAPTVLYPLSNSSFSHVELFPRSADPGYLVTKVIAVDADAGQNAWLSYSLLHTTYPSLFSIERHTGEIRTASQFMDDDSITQTLVILIKDHGQTPLSSTVTITLHLTDTQSGTLVEKREQLTKNDHNSNLNFCLLISVISVTIVFLITIVLLIFLKISRWRKSSQMHETSITSLYRACPSKVPLNQPEVIRGGAVPYTFHDSAQLTTRSCKSDILFYTSYNPNSTGNIPNTLELNTPNGEFDAPTEQMQPNTDWRFSQAQRPGTSGSQHLEEVGGWPSNQMDSERLQAMMAAANETGDGTSTLGAGTLGLSTRYGPQFTLQHVPDYRQNVYIPGSTATLTNSSGKKEGKGATSSGGNKRKSGKKDKK